MDLFSPDWFLGYIYPYQNLNFFFFGIVLFLYFDFYLFCKGFLFIIINDYILLFLISLFSPNNFLLKCIWFTMLCWFQVYSKVIVINVCLYVCVCMHMVARSCLIFTTPWTVARQAPLSMGILQARILEWVSMLSSRGFSWPRDHTSIS